jgi:protein TonB
MEDRATAEMAQAIEPADGDLLTSKELAWAHQGIHPGGGETEPGAVAHNDEMEKAGGAMRAQGFSEQQGSEQQRGTKSIALDGSEFMTETATQNPTSATETENHELDSFLGNAFEEKPIWTDLYENIRDVFFPKKLPPLELTSKPIPVVDPLAVKTNPWSFGSATAIQIGALALLILLGRQVVKTITPPQVSSMPVDISDFKIDMPKRAQQAGGGGGGGSHDVVDPIKGKLPKIEDQPKAPPMVPVVDKPKLAVDSAIAVQKDIKLPDNPNMINIGVKNSANVTMASNGQGSGAGMGTGSHGGIGPGDGNGYGPGSGGNYGGGVEHIGGGVKAPTAIYTIDPEFSEEARRAKYQGEVMVQIIVDAQGNVQSPRVVRPLGMGLDEKALEAVMKYKFKPGTKDGKPVAVYMTVAINFRLY